MLYEEKLLHLHSSSANKKPLKRGFYNVVAGAGCQLDRLYRAHDIASPLHRSRTLVSPKRRSPSEEERGVYQHAESQFKQTGDKNE